MQLTTLAMGTLFSKIGMSLETSSTSTKGRQSSLEIVLRGVVVVMFISVYLPETNTLKSILSNIFTDQFPSKIPRMPVIRKMSTKYYELRRKTNRLVMVDIYHHPLSWYYIIIIIRVSCLIIPFPSIQPFIHLSTN